MRRIGFLVLPGFQVMSVGALCVFEFANKEAGEPVYDVHLLSATGGSVRSSIGIEVATEPFDDRNLDTLIVGGSAFSGSVTLGVIKLFARLWGDPGGSRRSAPARSSWLRLVCSTADARRRTGTVRATCKPGSQK